MANLYIAGTPHSYIEYSLIDGSIWEFVYRGETLYSGDDRIAADGWRNRLADLINEQGLDVDYGNGLRAFVQRMKDDGMLPSSEKTGNDQQSR